MDKHASAAGNGTAEADRGHTNAGWPGTASDNTKTADGVAFDFSTKLLRAEKPKVAGLLSKTITGAE